jgi:Glycosyltransferase family 87
MRRAGSEAMEQPRRSRAHIPWRFSAREKAWLVLVLIGILGFGAMLERRTALRARPMSDLGPIIFAAWAVSSGENLYTIRDWHGWHYQYPPLMAILMRPFAHPLPAPEPRLSPGTPRTPATVPWGYSIDGGDQYYPLGRQNLRFFLITGAWYLLSAGMLALSLQALASGLEGRALRDGPPPEPAERLRWWVRRVAPAAICLTSIGTELSRGQVDMLMLLAIAFALYLAVRGRTFLAGICLIFPAMVKVFPAILVVWPVWRLNRRILAGSITGALLGLVVIPVAVLGPGRSVALYEKWMQVTILPGLGAGNDRSRARESTNMEATDNQSLLAVIHNWSYRALPMEARPRTAFPWARGATYAGGAAALAGVLVMSGWRRKDSPRATYLLVGLLTGSSLIVCPVTHHYYFLLLLPLIVALVDRGLAAPDWGAVGRALAAALLFFLTVDVAGRLPVFGGASRDLGLPLLSVLVLMTAGAAALREEGRRAGEPTPSGPPAAGPGRLP